MNKCPNCTDGYIQDTGFTECNYCNSARQSAKKEPNKTYDYNICIVDTKDMVQVLDILKIYGVEGWRFAGWTEMESEDGFFARSNFRKRK